MFANYLQQTLNSFKFTDSNLSETMSNEQQEYYKIPSTPIEEEKNSLIFTRSQCSGKNLCNANCLVHKKRKRRSKAQLNDNLNTTTETDSAIDPLDDTNSTTSTISNKRMPSKRRATKYPNYSLNENLLSDEEDEIVERTNVNRLNYYESFSNNFSDATTFANHTLTRQSTVPILTGLLIVFILTIYLYSTSQLQQQNSIIDFNAADLNHTVLKTEKQFNKVGDNLKLQTNLRAIESFKRELQQSFIQVNQRINRIENDLHNHRNSQQQLNKQLIDSSIKLNDKLNDKLRQTDETITELTKYKVQIDKFISEFTLVEHVELKLKFDDIRQLVVQLIKEAIDKYDADKTGIVDFASEFAGGEIISTGCTESYDLKGASYKILGVPIWSPPNIPRSVIQPNSSPGQCWYFSGNKGSLVIKLARTILPSNFSYEHIPLRSAPDGHISSAPKHFEVRALDGPDAEYNWLLGEFDYDRNGDSIQFFKFENQERPVEYIEFNVLDNHGNEEFTCLYRLRVHGTKVDRED